jgi:drug/metabolite transporter (DMT)-like permease
MISRADIEKYFLAEKQAGMLFLILGVVAVLVALIGIFAIKTSVWKGAAIPLIALGIIEAAIGYTIYSRSDEQRISNVYAIDMNPDKLVNQEIPRMQKVNKNFPIYKWAEIVVFVAGAILVFVYRSQPDKQFLYGLGFALAIEAVLLFAADTIAAKRAGNYYQQLQTLQKH